jgi:riboflavin kinase/FMN adenylyltransferase
VSVSPDEEATTGGGGSAVTIGAFDGVHLGHRKLIGELARVAAERGLRSVVVTFDRHPAAVVRPESAPLLLTDLEQKVELLKLAGADEVRVLHFDIARAAEEAPDFVREVLAGDLRARVVVVGSDFHFGYQRKGNVALLRAMGDELGFVVVGYDLIADGAGGEVVSSTRIRSLLAACEVERAAEMLGRPHEVRGEVVALDRHSEGDGGRSLIVAVPGEIALPCAGRYHGSLTGDGPSEDHRAEGVIAVVPAREGGGTRTELELHCADRPSVEVGKRARVRFSSPVAVASLPGDVGIRIGD